MAYQASCWCGTQTIRVDLMDRREVYYIGYIRRRRRFIIMPSIKIFVWFTLNNLNKNVLLLLVFSAYVCFIYILSLM